MPTAQSIIEGLHEYIDRLMIDVATSNLTHSTRTVAGATITVGYDIRKRTLPAGTVEDFQAAINQFKDPHIAAAGFDAGAFTLFISAIPFLHSSDQAPYDHQLNAIGLGRAALEAQHELSPALLGEFATYVVRAAWNCVVRETGQIHRRSVGESTAALIDKFARRVPGGLVLGSAAAVVALPFVTAGLAMAAAVTKKEDKAENKLMKWAMEIFKRIESGGGGLSDNLARACATLISSAGNGKRARAFKTEALRLATPSQRKLIESAGMPRSPTTAADIP